MSTLKTKKPKPQPQSERFVEAARKVQVDESGRTFSKALSKIVRKKPT